MPNSEPTPKIKRWKCTCAYDGTDFFGWQSQQGGNTIQDILEEKLKSLFKTPIRIHGSGRTDSGVHAKGQVFHFDAYWPHTKNTLLKALSSNKHQAIQITSIQRVSSTFHARYSVKKKRYTYTLYLGDASPFLTRFTWSLGSRQLSIPLMQKAANNLLGTHDFSAFGATTRTQDNKENPVKTLFMLDIKKKGKFIHITTEATGYLYKMVRSLVGSLVDVGLTKLTPDQILTILHSKQRTQLVTTAPARGLSLEKVYY